jgi:hypothetical protein
MQNVEGSWNGWDGETIVELTDGSVWKQSQYHYEYRYSYRPRVTVTGGPMLVDGMSRPIPVRRLA